MDVTIAEAIKTANTFLTSLNNAEEAMPAFTVNVR
jgi:hypothetical protein